MGITVVNVHGEVYGSKAMLARKQTVKEEEDFAEAPDIEDLVEKSEGNAIGLKPLEEFSTKDELEAYGLKFGIDLKKNKSLENMYLDLVNFVNK